MNIFDIIAGTPLWVFILFGYLLFSGIQSFKSCKVHLWRFMIMPTVFMIWSFYSIIYKASCSTSGMLFWIAAFLAGICCGYTIFNRMRFHVDKQTKLIHVKGTYINFLVSMTFFIHKYLLGILYALYPCMKYNLGVLSLDFCFSGFVSGFFLSRFLIILYAYLYV